MEQLEEIRWRNLVSSAKISPQKSGFVVLADFLYLTTWHRIFFLPLKATPTSGVFPQYFPTYRHIAFAIKGGVNNRLTAEKTVLEPTSVLFSFFPFPFMKRNGHQTTFVSIVFPNYACVFSFYLRKRNLLRCS